MYVVEKRTMLTSQLTFRVVHKAYRHENATQLTISR
jgi:hypothetical protein